MDIKEVAAYHRKRAQQVHEAGIFKASGNHLAMAEACERFTWRPIETAPRDGTRILAVSGNYGVRETFWDFYGEGSIAKAMFDRGEGQSGCWHWHEPQSHWVSSWTPAYWMPLPEPPV